MFQNKTSSSGCTFLFRHLITLFRLSTTWHEAFPSNAMAALAASPAFSTFREPFWASSAISSIGVSVSSIKTCSLARGVSASFASLPSNYLTMTSNLGHHASGTEGKE